MRTARNVFFTLFCIILTGVIIFGIYLFSSLVLGTIIFLSSLIILVTLIIYIIIGLITGRVSLFAFKSKFSKLLVCTYLITTSIILFFAWFLNLVLYFETSENFTARDKINIIQGMTVLSKDEQLEFTSDYSVLEHNNIRFIYHPDTKKQVYKIIDSLNSIQNIESEVFGRNVKKNEPLEVIVLRDSKDYLRANPSFDETVGGSYHSDKKRIIVYQDREHFDDDKSFMVGTFTHEYSHYLFDLFLQEEGIADQDIPLWFEEGICDYIRFQIVDTIQMPGNIDPTLALTELHTNQSWISASNSSDVYYLAQRAIEFIIQQQGEKDILSKILTQQKVTGSFEKSVEQITELNVSKLHKIIFSTEEELQKARLAMQNSDYVTAEEIYLETLKKHPNEYLVWVNYANMLEELKRWDEALDARRQVVKLTPNNAASYQSLSYLLTLFNAKESMEMGNKALNLVKQDQNGNVAFFQEWVDDISQYQNLLSKENQVEAYKTILQSEQLSYQVQIIAELKKQAKEKFPGDFKD